MLTKLKKIIGGFIMGLGYISFIVFGMLGFLISADILNDIGGFLLVVIGFIVAPVTYAVAPWYAAVEFNTFFPLIIAYGGLILGGLLYLVGSFIREL